MAKTQTVPFEAGIKVPVLVFRPPRPATHAGRRELQCGHGCLHLTREPLLLVFLFLLVTRFVAIVMCIVMSIVSIIARITFLSIIIIVATTTISTMIILGLVTGL